jgi:iduronate 2-sulfatase
MVSKRAMPSSLKSTPAALAAVLSLVALLVGAASGAPNILLLCVDDLRPDLGCYGVGYAITPHMDRLAGQSRIFTRHYVQAPTCGASRYSLLTGLYGPRDNDALLRRAADPMDRKPSLPEVFRKAGYTTVAVGKVSHHPGGLAGTNWNDPAAVEMPDAWDAQPLPCGPWRHPQGFMHGLANGTIRSELKQYPALQAVEGPDTIYPDGLITRAALGELGRLAKTERPFFLAVGWIRPHLPFGVPKRYLDLHAESKLPPIPHPGKPPGKTTWHKSAEFFQYHHGGKDPNTDAGYADAVRRHYAASVSYSDAQVGLVLTELKNLSLDRNTVVVLWGDHGWHLGEHAVWGKHTLFEESLRAPLIIRVPGMASPGTSTPAVVETLDLFPTLCSLAGIKPPDYLHGETLQPYLADPEARGRVAVSYSPGAETLRTDRHRLIRHRTARDMPYYELYDHQSPAGETRNIADQNPDLVQSLGKQLDERLPAPRGGSR